MKTSGIAREVGPNNAGHQRKFRITLEPVGFIFLTGIILQMLATPNLYLFKVCHINFNYSAELCDPKNQTSKYLNQNGNFLLNQTKNGTPLQHLSGEELINAVQIYVSQLETYMAIITNIPSIFFILFLGPWSDKHGRKPLLIVPMIGFTVATLVHMLNYYEESWPAEYNLISNAFIGFLGGQVTFHMAATRYTIDITDEENRTWRLSVLSGMIFSAVPIAYLLGSYIYEYGGPMASWGTSVALTSSAILYTIFFVKESAITQKTKPIEPILKNNHLTMRDKKDCATVFENLWICFTVTFKKRPGYERACICLLLTATLLGHFVREPHTVLYLFTRKMFSWNAPDFARYITVTSVVSVLGTLLILPVLSHYLKFKDGTIGSISMLGNIGSAFTVAFAVTPLMMYLSAIGNILAAGIAIAITTILSKIVGPTDLSHVLAVAFCLEAIEPLIAAPFFNSLYQATIVSFPGCVFLVEALFLIIIFVCFLTVLLLQRKETISAISSTTSVAVFNNDN